VHGDDPTYIYTSSADYALDTPLEMVLQLLFARWRILIRLCNDAVSNCAVWWW